MPSGLEEAVAIEVLLVIWIGVRSYRSYQGRRYSPQVLVFPVLIVFLFFLTEYDTITAVPWSYPVWLLAGVAILIVSALATLPIAPRLVRVTQRDNGQWYYQFGIELIAFYLALWVVRLGLAIYFDPASLEITTTTSAPLSATASEVLVLIQLLFAISSGLVVGRGIGTYRLAEKAQRASSTGPSPIRQA
jgi:hypothetical protein